jgi:hypothetical protein
MDFNFEPSHDESPDLLIQQLQEKDQLVTALTERLEQAAEQLDRLQRVGADRDPSMGSLPAELVEDQKELTEDLRRVVQQWEDMQAGATLGRLEIQLTELRDLVASGVRVAPPEPAAQEDTPQAATPRPKPYEPGVSMSWEAHKAAMLAEEDGVPAAPVSIELPEVVHQIPEAPAAIDLEAAEADDLRNAVRERDRHIELLTEQLQQVIAVRPDPFVLCSLADLPEEQRLQLEQWQTQLQERHRQMEIDLSLERARLYRDERELHEREEVLRKQLRRAEQEAENAEGKDGETTSGRSWLGFLGRSRTQQ